MNNPATSEDTEDMLPHKEMGQLTFEEKKFLLAVERGDVATVRRYGDVLQNNFK